MATALRLPRHTCGRELTVETYTSSCDCCGYNADFFEHLQILREYKDHPDVTYAYRMWYPARSKRAPLKRRKKQ